MVYKISAISENSPEIKKYDVDDRDNINEALCGLKKLVGKEYSSLKEIINDISNIEMLDSMYWIDLITLPDIMFKKIIDKNGFLIDVPEINYIPIEMGSSGPPVEPEYEDLSREALEIGRVYKEKR